MGFTNADIIRAAARYNHETYSRAAFWWAYRRKKLGAYHFRLLAKLCDEILAGKRHRVVVNMPPRFGKTEDLVVMLMSRVFAVNPSALNMHLSYSKNLALKNSVKVKELVTTPEYQKLFDLRIKKDTEGWWTTQQGGEFYATTTSGQVTGFECGRSGDPFDGIMVIDDPQKSKGIRSAADRESVKGVIQDAITTRINHEMTPVIVVQQRLGLDDATAFLLNGGTGDIWDTLVLQGLSEDGKPPEYYRDYSHCNLLNYQREPGALWPFRKSEAAMLKIKDAAESDDQDEPRGARAFAAQYQQSPADMSISLYESQWLRTYEESDLPVTLSEIFVRIDTAQKGTGRSDYHGMTLFGIDKRDRSKVFVLDAMRKRCQFPDLITWVMESLERWWHMQDQSIHFTRVTIEDANIGAALKSTLEVNLKSTKIRLNIELTPKYGNKFDRAMEALPFMQQGRVLIPSERTKWVDNYTMDGIKSLAVEFKTFNLGDTHASDDILDTVIWEVVTRYGEAPGGSTFAYSGF